MFTPKFLTTSSGLLLLIGIFVCGCTYPPTNSGTAGKPPQASFPPAQSAAPSIDETARFVKEKLDSCGSKRINFQPPAANSATRWAETSWTLVSTTGCVWQFEYSDNNHGYVGRGEPSSGWDDESVCSATVNLSQLALNSITTEPFQHRLDNKMTYEIYFTTFKQIPTIHLTCVSGTNIHVKSDNGTISDAGWKKADHQEPDLEHWADTGPFCTDQQSAGMIQKTLFHAAALYGARP
jgi:hypothetical protein